MSDFRIADAGRIDRGKPLAFTFNGRRLNGFAGDTLASALLANGVHLVARSIKYHRPRGFLSAGHEEPNAVVQLERGAHTEPNLRATEIELYEGLEAASVNCFPSVEFDLRVLHSLAAPLLVAGFYNKTFRWPKSFWKRVYEPAIRKAAGLGVAPELADPDRYDRMHWHCDVLVVGGGRAGLAAALQAARSGSRVTLVEEASMLGGKLLSSPAQWNARAADELDAMPNVLVLRRTSVFGYYDQNFLMAVERRTDHLGPGRAPELARKRLWHFRAKRVVLATGAHERPLTFGNNDLPGIVLAGAACTYAHRYGVSLGRRGAAFVNNDLGFRRALDAHALTRNLHVIVDARNSINAELADAAREAGVEVLGGSVVTHASGGKRIESIAVCSVSNAGERRIDCDHLLVSGGFNPAVHLFSQSPGTVRYDETLACFLPHRTMQAVESVGAANGQFSLNIEPLWSVQTRLGRELPGKHFVDFQNDVTERDIQLAAREGFHSVEHAKRYTTAGMATDQGKTSNVVTLALLGHALGKPIAEVGTTTFRPPFTPVTFGALAGRDRGALSDPVRTTPIHSSHVARGALFENVGQWKRPWYYPLAGEDMHAAVVRECTAVRSAAGIMDASTLGKIDIRGADAADFLERIYANNWKKLAVGACRYGLMCKADGMVFDDGVTARLAEDHFHMTTTTGGAGRVLGWLDEWLQTEWPDLEVYCTSVTEQWATVALAGPNARRILQALTPDIDLSNAAFPLMTFRTGTVASLPARVFRISFSGELAYEVNVAAWHGLALWEALMQAGAPHGLTPYGTEAMHVLRAEKGYIIVGQETDGSVTPQDLGMDWIVSKQKDFIGRRSFSRADTSRADRKQLVGLLPQDKTFVAREGQHLVASRQRSTFDPKLGSPSIGHVTSSYWSPTLGSGFALALISGGRALRGKTVFCSSTRDLVPMTVVDPVFYDKEGKRRDGVD